MINKEMIGADLRKASGDGYVYLASPYSKLVKTVGLDEAARIVSLAAGALIEERVVVFSPIAHGHAVSVAYGLDKLDQDMWMAQCYPMLRSAKVCVVLMFPGWRESAGVSAEMDFARRHGIPVVHILPEEVIPAHKLKTPA